MAESPAAPADSLVYQDVETESGTGNLTGTVHWNGTGAADLDVRLCEESGIWGCNGEQFDAKTDEAGQFAFTGVPTGAYNVAVRVFDTDVWIYPTSGILDASEFEVQEGKVLETSVLNIDKSLQLQEPGADQAIATATPTLSWQVIPEASYYAVYLSAEDNAEPYEPGISQLKVESAEYTLPEALTKCEYTWKIEAFNADGIQIAESDFGEFSRQDCPTS